ncbi:MAG: 50S ribosomal protein L24 [Methanocalculus sp.]|uniref:50S ribosomal protein L24 n=1 Tax=Methanocalculus sp. TaxID=2004547 RepID=UPI00271DD4E1|nr:50S ribosomal protein L24 [Methanocalculus sp.]MDO8841076.1 50S ribosomal protein L24 [Methanocalculus sp.]MDO9538439.1 50S ribosomal protein L24 [Methanocalculus sp.]
MVRIASSQPRKQRKIRYNAPIHLRGAFLHTMLSPELREKHGHRRVRVVTGDTVKVLRGEHTGTIGVVDGIDLKRLTIQVHGVTVKKADGTEVARPVDPSKVMITKLNFNDPKRQERIGVKE